MGQVYGILHVVGLKDGDGGTFWPTHSKTLCTVSAKVDNGWSHHQCDLWFSISL